MFWLDTNARNIVVEFLMFNGNKLTLYKEPGTNYALDRQSRPKQSHFPAEAGVAHMETMFPSMLWYHADCQEAQEHSPQCINQVYW